MLFVITLLGMHVWVEAADTANAFLRVLSNTKALPEDLVDGTIVLGVVFENDSRLEQKTTRCELH